MSGRESSSESPSRESRDSASLAPPKTLGPSRPRKWIEQEIARLDPSSDATRIYALSMAQLAPESAFAFNLYYTVGFIRMAGPPEGAKPVHHFGEGMVYRRGYQRADDTMLQILGWIDHGVESDASHRSLKRVKGMHGERGRDHAMPNQVFMHTACYFTLSLERILTLVGAAGLSELQREAQVNHWLQVSDSLGIVGVPETWRGMEEFLEQFEAGDEFTYSPEGHQVARALVEHFTARWFPPRLRWFGRWLPLALSEPHVLRTVGLQAPPRWFTAPLRLAVRAGVFAKRHLLPDPREIFSLSAVLLGEHNSFDYEHQAVQRPARSTALADSP